MTKGGGRKLFPFLLLSCLEVRTDETLRRLPSLCGSGRPARTLLCPEARTENVSQSRLLGLRRVNSFSSGHYAEHLTTIRFRLRTKRRLPTESTGTMRVCRSLGLGLNDRELHFSDMESTLQNPELALGFLIDVNTHTLQRGTPVKARSLVLLLAV